MVIAALLDLGASREKLDAVLESMKPDGFDYAVSRKTSYGIAGCDFDVRLHDHEHDHEHEHHHEHGHHHEHRNLADVCAVIDRADMTDRARALAKKIFRIVADAEAKAHGCPVEEVHFHEVGSIDSIVDIVGASVLLDDLNAADCIVSGLAEGSGTVRCAHGELPVPVPAVLNIAQEYHIPLRPSGTRGEMVTPTGIAIAAAVRTETALPAQYMVSKVGIGLGKRDFGRANILRVLLLNVDEKKESDRVFVLESNIDDASGEMLGAAMEKLFAAGALDVHYVPCFMKKNRPGYLLRVIASESDVPALEAAVFESTSTIGLRKYAVERTCMKREVVPVKLSCGEILAKRCEFGALVRFYPEYESVKKLSGASGTPFAELYRAAAEE